MIQFLFMFIYTIVLLFALVLAHLFYIILPFKIKKSLHLKWQSLLAFAKLKDSMQECILIHSASGEIEYAKPLIRELKKQNKNLVITYTSPSFLKLISNDMSDLKILPLPFDLPLLTKWWLKKLNVRVIYYSRTDVWPWMACSAQQLKIPQSLFSATFSQRIQFRHFLKDLYHKITLNYLDKVHVVSAQDAEYLKSLKLSSQVLISGDTRYDQVQFRKHIPTTHLEILKKYLSGKNWMSLGSTWPEDEVALLPILPELLQTRSLILAPHDIHQEHLKNLQNQLSKFARVVRLSELLQPQFNSCDFDILLVDQVGYLFYLYSFSQISFIGGSFKKNVHSVMEALCWGNVVLVGPYYHNNREAIEFSLYPLEQLESPQLESQTNSSAASVSFDTALATTAHNDKFMHNNEFSPLYVVMSIKETEEFFEFYTPLNNFLQTYPQTNKKIAQIIANKAGATERII